MGKMKRLACVIILTALLCGMSMGQETRDSLVRLLSADMARLVEQNGKPYRKVVGNAVFLHNNTYLKCDSASWNVEDSYIDAVGHVVIEQENTVLTGDSIRYVIAENTAKFRGHLVELVDRDSNVLRTNYLDYNTRDSVAFFYRGGAMKDADGNMIESLTGRYQSRIEQFDFIGQVEMFSDSLFFVCDTLYYYADRDVAEFFGHTAGWYDLNHISSGAGWYDRTSEKFFFTREVYGLTEEYEIWCDSLNYDRHDEYARLLGNVQLLDTVDNAITLAGDLRYWNEPRRAELYRDPAVVMINEEEGGVRDSVFMASDTLIYYSKRMFEIDSAVVAAAKERRTLALVDPLAKDQGDGSAQQQSGQQTAVQQGGVSMGTGQKQAPSDTLSAPDSLQAPSDTLSVPDSLQTAPDSLAVPPPDTTLVDFVEAYHHVKIFKSDIQVMCDSLLFTSIDSIARLFESPIIWYEITSQITADSMQFLVRNETLDKGLLFSNSFVISEEVPGQYYHQIKSPEMAGYFKDGQISRFDALGGVTAMFYVSEDSVITTMNQKECRIMTGRMKDGQVQRILYTENVKSDAYPVWDLTSEMMTLRDFNWMPDLRPADRFSVTPRSIHKSRRSQMAPSSDFPRFKYSSIYFEGYMENVMAEIKRRKPLIWLE